MKLRMAEPFEPLLEVVRPTFEFNAVTGQDEHVGPRNLVFHGGRGSAKSHSIAGVLAIAADTRPIRWLCGREIQKSLSTSSKQLLEDKIIQLGMRDRFDFTRDGIVHKHTGSRFLFAGLRTNPDAVKSMEGLDGAWLEEADTISEYSLQVLTPTLRKSGSMLLASYNRRDVKDPIDVRFVGGTPPPRSVVRKVSWRDNPFFPQSLKEEMEWMKARDYDKYLHVWEGEPWMRSEARVFPKFTIADLDAEVPEDCNPRFGADWGFSVDPTVLVKAYRFGRILYIRAEAYKVRCELDDIPALFAGDCPHEPGHSRRWENRHGFTGIPGAYRYPIVADSARPETISYMVARGFNMGRSIKGTGSVEEGVEFIRNHEIVVHPSCTHVIDELGTYSYKVDPLTDQVLPVLADKNNHTIDSIRYALEADRRAIRAGRTGGLGSLGIVAAGEYMQGEPTDY